MRKSRARQCSLLHGSGFSRRKNGKSVLPDPTDNAEGAATNAPDSSLPAGSIGRFYPPVTSLAFKRQTENLPGRFSSPLCLRPHDATCGNGTIRRQH